MSDCLSGIMHYCLLSETDRELVRATLSNENEHFYHATLNCHLNSNLQHGLHPSFEGEDSSYEHRQREPEKALRYSTGAFSELALCAARTRAQVWDDALGIQVPNDGEVVVIRVAEASILNRSFRSVAAVKLFR